MWGQVRDRKNQPVHEATVGIKEDAGTDVLIRSTVTDHTGYFQMKDVPSGVQTIRVEYNDGSEEEVIEIDSSKQQDVEMDFDFPKPVINPDLPVAAVEDDFIYLDSLNQTAILNGDPSIGDDLEYIWNENPDNPLLGMLPGNSERMSLIQLSGFSKPGIYIYRLEVKNEEGTSKNSASVTVLAPGLSGNVHASPSDGIFGLNAATVRAYSDFSDAERWMDNDKLIESTQTRDNPIGDFSFKGLSPGSYWLVAKAQSDTGFNQYGPVLRRVNHSSTARESMINIPRDEFKLDGVITDKETGEPIENVRIVAAPGTLSESYRTTTDALGKYHLSAVPRGSSQPVMLMHEDYKTRISFLDINKDLTQDMTLEQVLTQEKASISGTVTALYEDTLLPVPYAEVIIGSGLARTFTDGNGEYSIDSLPPGYYFGTIRKDGYIPQGLGDFGFINLEPDENTVNKVLSFKDHGPVVSGSVVNEQGQKVEGAVIRVGAAQGDFLRWAKTPEAAALKTEVMEERDNSSFSVPNRYAGIRRTNAAGSFQLVGVPHGLRQVEAVLPDGRVFSRSVFVEGNMRIILRASDLTCRPPDCFTLTYNAGQGGRIEGESFQQVMRSNHGTPVTAVAHTGYHFVSWSDGLKDSSRQERNVSESIQVSAEFAVNKYEIKVDSYTPGGSVAVIGDGRFEHNKWVRLIAVPDEGYRFMYWKEDGRIVSRDQEYIFQARSNRKLLAYFREEGVSLPGVMMLLLDD